MFFFLDNESIIDSQYDYILLKVKSINNYKPKQGDLIEITGPYDYASYDDNWAPEMNKYIGNIVKLIGYIDNRRDTLFST